MVANVVPHTGPQLCFLLKTRFSIFLQNKMGEHWKPFYKKISQGHGCSVWFHLLVPNRSEHASQSAPKWPTWPRLFISLPAKDFQGSSNSFPKSPLDGCWPRLQAAIEYAQTLHTDCRVHRPPHPQLVHHRSDNNTVTMRRAWRRRVC